MVHVSMSCNPAFHTTGAHYINADTTAFMQLIMSDLFKDFPKLRLIIPHGGGAVPFHWGRYPRARAAEQAHADRGDDQEQRVLRHLRLSPAGRRTADQSRADRQYPVRVGNDRRGADRRSEHRAIISTTPSVTSTACRGSRRRTRRRFTRTTPCASIRASRSVSPRSRRSSPRARFRGLLHPSRRAHWAFLRMRWFVGPHGEERSAAARLEPCGRSLGSQGAPCSPSATFSFVLPARPPTPTTSR